MLNYYEIENCQNCPFSTSSDYHEQGFHGTIRDCRVQDKVYFYNTDWRNVFENCPLKSDEEIKMVVTLKKERN